MGIQVVCKTCSYKNVAPILLRQLDCFLKPRNITSAQFQRCKTNPLQLELITLFTKREVIAALIQKKVSDFALKTRGK